MDLHIRSEVEADAEVIIGAITDPSLEGKIRASIVATSLDGQQPETKSVINMVHRIQNRNPGYSDFSNLASNTSFNFSNNQASPLSHGANALKLENEIVSENFNESVSEVNEQYNEELLKNQGAEGIIENVSNENEVSFSQEVIETSKMDQEITNEQKEFGVDNNEPDLFNSDNQDSISEDLLGSNESEQDEDDLEIPAFLRRQKN